MTWETEDTSDAQSQSQMTTDTYGYGEGNDQNIIWSDDPERAYFKSMIQGEGDQSSLIGDATINELLEDNNNNNGRGGRNDPPTRMVDTSQNSDSYGNPMVDSSGLSYYDTDAEDDTIGKIEADDEDHGWFAMRRSKQQQAKDAAAKKKQKKDASTKAPAPPAPLQLGRDPAPQGPQMSYNIKSPISALSPQDKAGDGFGPNQPFAIPNPNIVPASPGNRPVPPPTPADGREIMADLEGFGEDGKIIPGYIFVTAGHSSAVQTKQSPKGAKALSAPPKAKRSIFGRQSAAGKAQPPPRKSLQQQPDDGPTKFTKKELTDDTDELAVQRRKRKYFLCKIGIIFLLLALLVGIAMLSLVFISKRERENPDAAADGTGAVAPTMPPNFFVPEPEPPTATPTSPPGTPTLSPTVETASPTTANATAQPTAATAPPTVAVVGSTAVPTTTLEAQEEALKLFFVSQFPDSAPALEDSTSPQFQALQWILEQDDGNMTIVSTNNRRVRGRRQLQDQQDDDTLNWRLVQRWSLAVLYFATGGIDIFGNASATTTASGWRSASGWLESPEECDWDFVVCNDAGKVQELSIQDNALVGTIPPEVAGLAGGLLKLSLNENELQGSIPTSFGLLTNLNRLSLHANQMTGSLPTELGDMTSLRFLTLARNLFSGPIPTHLGNMISLKSLDLGLTRLSGSIPTELGLLTGLELISLGSSKISGTIPTELGDLPLLTSIKFDRMDLVGSMPDGICSRPSVVEDIMADCDELSCPCCTICCLDSGDCTGTTPEPTASPTRVPTRATDTPAASPTPKPTKSPTRTPIASPTPQPTPVPTVCEPDIFTDDDCYENGDDVVVFFNNCDASFDDWVGVYTVGQNFTQLDEPVAWVWTAGDQFRQLPVPNGNVTFFEAQGNGIFRVVLARNQQQPPYSAYAISNEFRLGATCT